MQSQSLRRFSSFIIAIFFASACFAQTIAIKGQKPTGVYDLGQKVAWRVEVHGGTIADADYQIKKGAFTVVRGGKLDLSSGSATVETTGDEPGTILLEIKAKAAPKPIRALSGAVVEPWKIQPALPRPDDFDQFWKSKLDELNAVPENAAIEPADAGDSAVKYFKVRLDNIRGTHIYGQLARPAKDGKFPALLQVQWAGIYPLPRSNVVTRAAQGWLTLNIMAHDLPFDQPEDYYKKISTTTLKDYLSIGCEDREKSYFLRMYLACYRAAEYLSNRPDWDGRTLVVMGTSQGGQQTFITAALNPKITAMLANVPGGCDPSGQTVGRLAGYPYWHNAAKGAHRDANKVMETSRYYDVVNFASRIKCPAMVSCGLIDETCPAPGVLAACNQLQGPKDVLILPESDHHGNHGAQAAYFSRSEQWLRELIKGNAGLLK